MAVIVWALASILFYVSIILGFFVPLAAIVLAVCVVIMLLIWFFGYMDDKMRGR